MRPNGEKRVKSVQMNTSKDINQSVEITSGQPFILNSGKSLDEVVVCYNSWGELSPAKDNAILLCHALTGDSQANKWWGGLVGEGKAIDTNKYFVVCSNVLGGDDGTTGPATCKDFPIITIRDMVRAQERLSHCLGVESWASVIGGSMGGMQALEWSLIFPEMVRSIVPICTTLAATPWQIAFSSIGRNIIELGNGSPESLSLARGVAMVSYRSDKLFQEKFGRDLTDPEKFYELWNKFEVENYLKYQGTSLSRRFSPDSYLILNKAMDLHDIGRNRGGVEKAAKLIDVPTLIVGVDSDILYPVRLQEEMAELIGVDRIDCKHVTIESDYGHDGFLLENQQMSKHISPFLADIINLRNK